MKYEALKVAVEWELKWRDGNGVDKYQHPGAILRRKELELDYDCETASGIGLCVESTKLHMPCPTIKAYSFIPSHQSHNRHSHIGLHEILEMLSYWDSPFRQNRISECPVAKWGDSLPSGFSCRVLQWWTLFSQSSGPPPSQKIIIRFLQFFLQL
jgi:hypothetical protein